MRVILRSLFHRQLRYKNVDKFERICKCKVLGNQFYSTSEHLDSTDENNNEKRHEKSKNLEELLENSVTGKLPYDEIDEDDEWQTSPYPPNSAVNWKQSQARKSLRPRVDPKETSIILFPGQGCQFVGMGKDLLKFPAARDIFEAANAILKYDLLNIMLKGPKSVLDKTVYCQPAIYVCSLAAIEKLKEENPTAIENCMATAGYSLGEITALTFSGVFSFDAGLKLVKIRSEAMQLASEMVQGGMALIQYGPQARIRSACLKAKEWCTERGIENPECRIAIYIGPNTKVVAGNLEALQYLETRRRDFKISLFKRIDVSGAFHTRLMKPAVEPFKEALSHCKFSIPNTRVYSNATGKRYFDLDHIMRALPTQIYQSVLWEQIMHGIYERPKGEVLPWTYSCGPGADMKSFLKLNNAKAAVNCTVVN